MSRASNNSTAGLPQKSRVAVVAALSAEVQAFDGSAVPVAITGVGKVQATLGMTKLIAMAQPELVVVAGTAGCLRDDLEPGVYVIGAASQHDYSKIGGFVHNPDVDPPEVIRWHESHWKIATGDKFVEDPELRQRLRRDADFCDMETYAYAYVCQQAGVPLVVLKAVSDSADGTAGKSWIDSVAECSEQLWDAARQVIGQW